MSHPLRKETLWGARVINLDVRRQPARARDHKLYDDEPEPANYRLWAGSFFAAVAVHTALFCLFVR